MFYPGNPLHVGAVLIRGDKIYSVANVLPLSNIVSDGKKLGTCHGAALRISGKCDALVLLVSEETGIISFAIDGSLFTISVTSSFI
ncbi:diadenylate cyclase [Psychrobacillus sp. L4]|uniref:diadenylate cyclase n=1 Tax=Psychrobacillus sp. L4 TaxID=3236892 RepID=UPI0036F2D9D3